MTMYRHGVAFFDGPFWGRGFRPFFMAAAFYAVFMIVAWSGVYAFGWPIPGAGDPVLWHAREMVFGFTLAVIAGFLLTAVASWTGWLPVRRGHLAALVFLWLAGRVFMMLDTVWALLAATISDVVFLAALSVSLGWPLFRRRLLRDALVLGVLAMFAAVDILFWLRPSVDVLRAGVLLAAALAVLIGGRIIPSFTVAGLRQRGLVLFQTDQPRLDAACFALSLAIVVSACFRGAEDMASRALFLVLAVLLLARMRYYHVRRVLAVPMLWILHVGYLWIAAGHAMLALGVPAFVAIHAFTAGGIGSLCLGMMTRVALGHTGRDPCVAPAWMTAAFLLVQVAAFLRVFAFGLWPEAGHWIVPAAGGFWAAAFAVCLAVIGPVLITPRPDGRPA